MSACTVATSTIHHGLCLELPKVFVYDLGLLHSWGRLEAVANPTAGLDNELVTCPKSPSTNI